LIKSKTKPRKSMRQIHQHEKPGDHKDGPKIDIQKVKDDLIHMQQDYKDHTKSGQTQVHDSEPASSIGDMPGLHKVMTTALHNMVFDKKMGEADDLIKISLIIPNGRKQLSAGDKEKTTFEIERVIADIMCSSKYPPATVSKKQLEGLGLTDREISEIGRLQELLKKLRSGAPVDNRKVGSELAAIIGELKSDAMESKFDDGEDSRIDYDHKMHDAEKLKELELHLPTSGLTTKAQDIEIQRSVRDIIGDLAGDSNIDPSKMTKKGLREKGLDPKTIDELMKLKVIYQEVDKGKAVDVKHIKQELDEVIAEIEKDAEHKRAEEDILKNADEFTHKMYDAEKLKELELHLPIIGKTNADQDYEIQKSVRDIMQDLAHDKNLNPETMSKKDLMRMDLDPKTIDELMKLKGIWNEVKDGKPVDSKHLRQELDEVVVEMEKDAEHKRAEDDILKNKDEFTHKMHDAEILKELELHLPAGGKTTVDQDYEIQRSCRDIIRDLAGDQNLDPAEVNKQELMAKGLDPKTINEIMQLQHIYTEVHDGKPVDVKH
jgi:hypothetical protein